MILAAQRMSPGRGRGFFTFVDRTFIEIELSRIRIAGNFRLQGTRLGRPVAALLLLGFRFWGIAVALLGMAGKR